MQKQIITAPIWRNPYRNLVLTISFLLIMASILYEFFSLTAGALEFKNGALLLHRGYSFDVRFGDYVIYLCFVVLPPLYIMVEYIHIFPDELKVNCVQLNDLKYRNQLSAKVWVGMILVITAYFWIRFGS